MIVIPDKKLVDKLGSGMSKKDKATIMFALLLATPQFYIKPEDVIPLQKIEPSHGAKYYMDLKYGK